MVTLCSGCLLPSSSSAPASFRACLNVRRARPDCWRSDWLETLTVNSTTSPSLRNRGAFGCTIRSLAVTASAVMPPERNCGSCAKPRNFHRVRASGMVNCIRTTPFESAMSCGKKKAVSARFFRAATALRSATGAGAFAGMGSGAAADLVFNAAPGIAPAMASRGGTDIGTALSAMAAGAFLISAGAMPYRRAYITASPRVDIKPSIRPGAKPRY